MADFVWLKPVLVGQFAFLEWTGENHLRPSKFIGLRDDRCGKLCSNRGRQTADRDRRGQDRDREVLGRSRKSRTIR